MTQIWQTWGKASAGMTEKEERAQQTVELIQSYKKGRKTSTSAIHHHDRWQQHYQVFEFSIRNEVQQLHFSLLECREPNSEGETNVYSKLFLQNNVIRDYTWQHNCVVMAKTKLQRVTRHKKCRNLEVQITLSRIKSHDFSRAPAPKQQTSRPPSLDLQLLKGPLWKNIC